MVFSQWIEFEANRIVSMGQNLPEERRVGYIRLQIERLFAKHSLTNETDLRKVTSLVRCSKIRSEMLVDPNETLAGDPHTYSMVRCTSLMR